MSIMLEEIRSQPDVIARLQIEAAAEIGALAKEVKARSIGLVVLAARGTSDHAAIFGQYVLEYLTGLPVALAAPSIVTLYRRPLRLANALVIGLSQSGEAADVDEYLAAARDAGALTATITNVTGSTMARHAEHLLLCRAGEEKAVAATKTYTAEMAILAMLALALSGDGDSAAAFRRLPEKVRETLRLEEEIRGRAERYAFMDECVILARGLNQATALETALKIQETSYIGARGFSAADFLHGPIAVLRRNYPVLVFAPAGAVVDGLHAVATKVAERGGELVAFGDDERILSMARTAFRLPSVDELFSPFTCIAAAQMLACFLAEAKGYDPDRPQGLKKVTVTR